MDSSVRWYKEKRKGSSAVRQKREEEEKKIMDSRYFICKIRAYTGLHSYNLSHSPTYVRLQRIHTPDRIDDVMVVRTTVKIKGDLTINMKLIFLPSFHLNIASESPLVRKYFGD